MTRRTPVRAHVRSDGTLVPAHHRLLKAPQSPQAATGAPALPLPAQRSHTDAEDPREALRAVVTRLPHPGPKRCERSGLWNCGWIWHAPEEMEAYLEESLDDWAALGERGQLLARRAVRLPGGIKGLRQKWEEHQ